MIDIQLLKHISAVLCDKRQTLFVYFIPQAQGHLEGRGNEIKSSTTGLEEIVKYLNLESKATIKVYFHL